jgi:hypothetical protein
MLYKSYTLKDFPYTCLKFEPQQGDEQNKATQDHQKGTQNGIKQKAGQEQLFTDLFSLVKFEVKKIKINVTEV